MASSSAETVEDYLDELPDDRAEAIGIVRDVIVANLPAGVVEDMSYGMITYTIPLETYPNTYNKKPAMYAALASQKNHMAVYLSGIYGDPEQSHWFRSQYKATGKRMDMGKSCVRFKKLEHLPVDLIGEAIARVSAEDLIEIMERARS